MAEARARLGVAPGSFCQNPSLEPEIVEPLLATDICPWLFNGPTELVPLIPNVGLAKQGTCNGTGPNPPKGLGAELKVMTRCNGTGPSPPNGLGAKLEARKLRDFIRQSTNFHPSQENPATSTQCQ